MSAQNKFWKLILSHEISHYNSFIDRFNLFVLISPRTSPHDLPLPSFLQPSLAQKPIAEISFERNTIFAKNYLSHLLNCPSRSSCLTLHCTNFRCRRPPSRAFLLLNQFLKLVLNQNRFHGKPCSFLSPLCFTPLRHLVSFRFLLYLTLLLLVFYSILY